MTVQDLYVQSIKPLPAADRLALARMILDGIPPESVVDHRERWSAEDIRDFTEGGWQRAGDVA